MKNEETKFNVSLSRFRLKQKPLTKKGKSIISNSLKSVSLTYRELVDCLTAPNSQTISPSVFKYNQRKNENWLSQQIFMLDFDGKLSKDKMLERFKSFGLTPNFIYYTFSHTPEIEKYRVVLILDKEITNFMLAKFIRKGLLLMFPEADEHCVDAGRMFFGGLHSEEWKEEEMGLDSLITVLNTHFISSDKMQTRKAAANRAHLYNHYRSTLSESNSLIIQEDRSDRLTYLKSLSQNKFNFPKCIEQVKILKDFDDGVWLHYPQLLGLATNLKWLKGGMRYMKRKMEEVNEKDPDLYNDNAFAIISNMNIYNYYPQRLSKYSPYEEDHQYTDLIDAVKTVRGHIEVMEKTEKIELNEAENRFKNSIEFALNYFGNNIHLIKAPTAIGKTRYLINLDNTTLCTSTHGLKDELSNLMEIQHLVTPETPEFESKKLNDIIKTYYSMGLNKKVYTVIRDVSNNICDEYENTGNDSRLAFDYLQKLDVAKSTDQTVLTTHLRGLFDSFNHDTIIFDEDPLNSILSTNQMFISDLKKVSRLTSNSILKNIVSELENAKQGETYQTKFDENNLLNLSNRIVGMKLSSNVLEFFNSSHFIRDIDNSNIIHYITKREFPNDKKIIILSATAPIEIYQRLFGERLKVYDISNVKNQGEVIQHTKKSFSKYSMRKFDRKNLKDLIDGINVITFKCKKNELGIDLNMHFGNCAGYDELKGKDIVVLGTPHLNPIQYLLFASVMGIDVNMEIKMREQRVQWNGFRFRFMTFDDPRLQKIQLGLIEAELVQAVGRARPIRTDAKVEIYSNLPLQIADRFVEN